MPEKKVLFLSHSFFRFKSDELSHYINTLAQELAKKGRDVHILLPHASGLAAEEMLGKVKISRFRYFFEKWENLAYGGDMAERVQKSFFYKIVFLFLLAAFFFKTRKLVKKEKPAILHAHWWIPGGVAAFWHSFFSKIPYLVTLHGTDLMLLKKSGFLRGRARRVFARAARITVVSHFLKNELVSLFPETESKIAVIPMPIDPEVLQREPKANIPGRIILCPARLMEQKNLGVLLEAFAPVAAYIPDAKLLIVGSGPKETELKNKARYLDLDKKVEFLPAMPPPKLGRLYQAAEVVTLVSKNEGFGLVLVEAFLFQKPVVAARSGGIGDIVADGGNGFLVDPDNPEEMADALKKLLADADLRKKMGEKGRRTYLEKFSPAKLAEKFDRLYAEIAGV
ncbi:MAG: glycosyltransferase family 4 protein [candidate division Zixibacteria bacterium]|nr:glycosyltransferase family 4 protein [candidate division Zixibacteria bacterium]